MTWYESHADGVGGDGTVVTVGNSSGGGNRAATAVSGSPTVRRNRVNDDFSGRHHYLLSGNTVNSRIQIGIPSSAAIFNRCVARWDTNPSTGNQFILLINAGGTHYIGCNTSGQIVVVYNGSTVSTSGVLTGQTIRIQTYTRISTTVGEIKLRISAGSASPRLLHSYDSAANLNTGGTNATSQTFGKSSASGNWTVRLSDIAIGVSEGTFLGQGLTRRGRSGGGLLVA